MWFPYQPTKQKNPDLRYNKTIPIRISSTSTAHFQGVAAVSCGRDGLIPAASTLRHQFTTPQVFVSGAPHYLQCYLIILSPACRSDSCYGCGLHFILSSLPLKKNPIFIPPVLLFFSLYVLSSVFPILVFYLTTIVAWYESVVSAAKPPGDTAAVAAAKKRCTKRSRTIRTATIVKNIARERKKR